MYEQIWNEPPGGWLAHYGFRPEAVDYHVGPYRDLLRRHAQAAARAVQTDRHGFEKIAPYLLPRIADPRALRCAWDDMRNHGGSAPGQNKVRFDDLDEPEVWNLLRAVGNAIRGGTYRPGKDRICRIPKGSGRGHRVLRIRDIEDRVVERAVVLVVQPLLDPLFDDHSFGYRPGRGRHHPLALAEQLTIGEQRPVWVTEDIRNAFDNVPHGRLMDLVSRYLPAPELVELIKRIIATATMRGLRQGGPLSPLLLNLYLHHHLDRPWRKKHPRTPLVRVADDLLLLCQTADEAAVGRAAMERLLLPTGLQLKGSSATAIHHLGQGNPATWLGFVVGDGKTRLQVHPAESAWERLEDRLGLCHSKPDSALRAVAAINGWVGQLGPAYPFANRRRDCQRIVGIAQRRGFDEIPGQKELLEIWRNAHARWSKLRNFLRDRSDGISSPRLSMCQAEGPGPSPGPPAKKESS